MKKLIGLGLLACLMCTGCAPVVLAEGTQQAVQDTDVDASGVCVIVNKQPAGYNDMAQTVKIRRSGVVFVINVNGKVQLQNQTGTESK